MRKGWQIKKLKEVCDKITDGTHQTPTYFKEGIIFLSSKNVARGKIDWDNIKYINEDQHVAMHKRVAPKINDILLAKNGTTGVAAIVDRDVVFDIYVSLAHLRPLKELLPNYLLYFLNSPSAKKQFNRRLKGMGVPNLHLEEIREVEIPIPSLFEQKGIVKILDEVLTAIDKVKGNVEKNLQNSKELFESYINTVFSNKEKDWTNKKLVQITTKIGSGATPLGGEKAYKKAGISLIRSLNVYDSEFRTKDLAFIDEDQAMKLNNVIIEKQDILFNITGASIARCCIVPDELLPARVNQHVSIIRLQKNIVLPRFVQLSLISKANKKKLLKTGEQGATRQAITKAQLEEFEISYPKTIKEQQVIIDKLEDLYFHFRKLQAIYTQKLNDLVELKKSILQKAFTGELTVSTKTLIHE